MPELTFNEHIAAATAIARARQKESANLSRGEAALTQPQEVREQHEAAARDLALTITHLEDANTRYNSGRYHQRGMWMRADPDKVPTERN